MAKSILILLVLSLGLTDGFSQSRKAFALFEQAESLYADRDYKQALAILNDCLKEYPDYLEAYALRGNVREQMNDNDGALTDYSIYLDKLPAHAEVLLNRAVIRYKVGYYDQAIEDFQTLLRLPPSGETNALFLKRSMSVDDRNPVMTMTPGGNHYAHVYNYLGLTELKRKNPISAKVYFDSAIRRDAKEADYFVNRGLAKEALNDSTAQQDYEHALVLNKSHTLARHNLAAARSKKYQSSSAEERLTETIQADSTMLYPYLERAQQRFESKYYAGAIDDYNNALAIDSTNAEIWLGRGLAKERLKDYKGAFSDYTKAIDLRENFAKAWINRGNVLLKLERYEDAIEDYGVALVYYPDNAGAFYNRAMAKVKLKRNTEACEDLRLAEQYGMKIDSKTKSKVCSN